MTNAYVSLDTLKSSGVLNITDSDDDARLLGLIEAMSRVIDRYCNRHFYAFNATKLFDGYSCATLLVPDLISVDADGFKTDDNLDRVFETTWASSDYMLLPSNADPATSGNPQSRPYTRVEVDVHAGTKRAFPLGIQSIQIAGKWGWWSHVKRATETANAIADATTTSVTVSSRADIQAGHTILIDSEQMYVQSYSSDTLSVVRGINGTTTSSHSGGADIDIYEYPAPVVEAAIMQASRMWRRKDSAFSNTIGIPETGRSNVLDRLDPDVMLLLGQYRKLVLGVSS